ncbi:hypothetical protein CLV84_0300 [Neolewinella xylanilytica]|uniref:Uncharacterized protein n=1 Tax=Neolewinella xylanilytica TaxID=1514080 RepID=A0A2S6I793_9BACT|nr:hypothetical protein [Neolewinella xylanilytica]PPK87360.1 hypothetical protein CLV84_0300 [Neolewinella xylanilytica]
MKTCLLLAFLLPLLPCAAQTSETGTPEDQIRATFGNYKSAILNDEGERALGYVDSRTLAYYGDMLEKTRTADSATVDALPIMDKLMVLAIRHRTSHADLLRFDAEKLFVYAIEQGMVGKSSVMHNEIGEVELDGNYARGKLVVNGTPAPAHFDFYDEGGWKVDLTSIFPLANQGFEQLVRESGEPENAYLLLVLEIITGNPAGPDIWQPVVTEQVNGG